MVTERRNTDQDILDLINKLNEKISDHAAVEQKALDEINVPKPFEKHFQTILVSIITAAIIFVATFVYSNNRQTGELALKLEFVSTQLVELKTKMDFMSSSYVTKPDFNELEKRVRVLEVKK